MKKIKIAFTLTATCLAFILNAQEQPSTAPSQPTTAAEKPQLPKVKEFGIGVGFSDLVNGYSGYSLQYRWGNDNRLYRIQGNIGGSFSLKPSAKDSNQNYTPLNLACGLSFSVLKIKTISDKFGFLYGGIYSLNYSENQSISTRTTNNYYSPNSINNNTYEYTSKRNTQTFKPSIGLALGGVYIINNSFRLYAEIDPNIYYAYSKSTTFESSSQTYPNQNNANKYNSNSTNNSSPTSTFGISSLSNSGASLTIVYRITK